VNTASIAYSRLSMTHSEENSATNDIVGQLGIQGVGFGGARAWGAPYFNVQGYSPMGDTYQATPMQSWDTILEGREIRCRGKRGSHSIKTGGSYRRFIWPMWAYVLSRGYYQFTNGYTTQTATADGSGSALASMELGLPAVRQRQVGSPHMNLRQWYGDAFVQDAWRIGNNHHDQYRSALRVHESLDRRFQPMGGLVRHANGAHRLHRRAVGQSEGPAVFEQAGLRPAARHRQADPRMGIGGARRVWHLLHAGGHEHLVQTTCTTSRLSSRKRIRATASRHRF